MSYIEPALTFACIPEVQDSSALGFNRKSYSFEEVRVLDYLRFYQTTGGPPPPCPAEPHTTAERTALGLPPLFTPWKDPTAPIPLHQPMPNGTNPPLDDQMAGNVSLQELPRIQVYAPVRVGHEIYQDISCMPRFRGYSVEELRWSAYSQGLKYAPVPVPTPPLGEEEPARTRTSSSGTPTVIISDGDETLEHISTHPDFSKHSPEELRLAFVRSGRELNSQQLLNV